MQFLTPESAMQHALALARRGLGFVEPNPPVGAVVVDDSGQLIAEGWHQKFGGPHAEVFALAAAGERARGATLYCTLEPCSHHGKTPPCAPAVIAAGIRKVVIGSGDPAPHVNGCGIAQLRAAGLEVQVGVCESDARRLIAPFWQQILYRRPWVHAKWAMSLDGRIATRTGNSKWISGVASRQRVHELRGRCDAIVTGIGTVLADDPLLTARPPGPRVALRVVLDSQLRIPLDCQLIRTAPEIPLLIVTSPSAPEDRQRQLSMRQVEVIRLEGDAGEARPSLSRLLSDLGDRHMTHVLLEGGAGLLGTAHDAGLIDEYHIFIAPRVIGGEHALSPVGGLGTEQVSRATTLTHVSWESLEGDLYLHGDRSRQTPDNQNE